MAYEGVDARASASPAVITAAFPVFWLAAVIASETATKQPRRLFQTFLKILFIDPPRDLFFIRLWPFLSESVSEPEKALQKQLVLQCGHELRAVL